VSHAAVAERYARAVFELGVETGQLEALTAQVRDMASAYAASPELRHVLENPLILEEERHAVLRQLAERLNVGPLVLNAVRLMALRRRVRALPDMALRLDSLADAHAGVVRAVVTTAVRLPDDYYEQLAQTLGQSTSRRVVIEQHLDPSLIAGVVTRIGDMVVDGSLKGRLIQYEHQLLCT
jgi:F-type H+-transporting ATPase subunit delta